MSLPKHLKPQSRLQNRDPFVFHSGKHKGRMESSYQARWSEDTFISDNQERETVGRSFDFSKVTLIIVGLVLMFSMLLGRAIYLQVMKGDDYYLLAEGNRIRIKRIEPKRGVIYDRNMKPLVRNQANFLLYFVPIDLPGEKAEARIIFESVSSILGDISVDEIIEKVSKINRKTLEAYQPLFIVDNIEYEKALKLYLEAEKWSGVILSNKTRREDLEIRNI